MRSISAIFLSFLVLIQSWVPNANNELPKFVDLLIHYQEHNDSENLNFIEFWDLHYGWCERASTHDNEEHHEGKFPFHGTQTTISNLLVFTPLIKTGGLISPLNTINTNYPEYEVNTQVGINKVEFQPPKLG